MIVGFDPSISNWGVALGDIVDGQLQVMSLHLISTSSQKAKSVFQDDLRRCQEVWSFLQPYHDFEIFAESPTGSQNSRGAFGRGVVIAYLSILGGTFYTPTQVKKYFTGNPKASKKEMIDRGKSLYPSLNWLNTTKDEHLADALAVLLLGFHNKINIPITRI